MRGGGGGGGDIRGNSGVDHSIDDAGAPKNSFDRHTMALVHVLPPLGAPHPSAPWRPTRTTLPPRCMATGTSTRPAP